MPEGNPLSKMILLIILIAINGLFAMSEIAVISFNDNKLKRLANDGNKKAKTLANLTSQPSRFLATIQVGVTLSGLLTSAVAADTFVDYIVFWFNDSAMSPAAIRMISLIVLTFVLSYITLVLGELVPKRIAMNNPEKISFGMVGILRAVSFVTRPFVWLLSVSANAVLRLLGIDPNKAEKDVTEEEIRMMIDVGEEDGTINESERDMLHNIFEFDDRTAQDIMSHRTELVALDKNSSLKHVIATAIEHGHSRFPVCDGGLDNIVGILYVKDLLELVVGKPDDFDISRYMRRVMYVPESARCRDIFEEFRTDKVQLAVVVDEYGGTAGIVTMEDLLESIVGNIQDEYDHEPDDITKISDAEYVLDGTSDIEEVADALGVKFDSGADYETIGGFIVNKLRHIPKKGEFVEYQGFRFTVASIDEHRVSFVNAIKINEDE